MSFIKVAGHEGLYRDTSTGAIINRNSNMRNEAIRQHQLQKTRIKNSENMQVQIDNLNQRMNGLEGKLDTIINLLQRK